MRRRSQVLLWLMLLCGCFEPLSQRLDGGSGDAATRCTPPVLPFTIVEQGGRGARIALLGTQVHILHGDTVSGALRYAVGQDGLWTKQVVDGAPGASFGLDLTVSSTETTAVFVAPTSLNAQLARLTTGWQVDSNIIVSGARTSSLELDATGTLHLLTTGSSAGMGLVEYRKQQGTSWSAPVVLEDHGADLPGRPAMSLGPDGTIHVVSCSATGGVRYHRAPAGATFEAPKTVAANIGNPQECNTSVVFADGALHVSYYRPATSSITYIRGDGLGAFQSPEPVLGETKLAHGLGAAGGEVWVSVVTLDNRLLLLSRSTGWAPIALHTGSDVKVGAELVIDATGMIHIATGITTLDAMQAVGYGAHCPNI